MLSERRHSDDKISDTIKQNCLQKNNTAPGNALVAHVNKSKTTALLPVNTSDHHKKPEKTTLSMISYDKHMNNSGNPHKNMFKQSTFESRQHNNKQLTFYKSKDSNGGAAAAA